MLHSAFYSIVSFHHPHSLKGVYSSASSPIYTIVWIKAVSVKVYPLNQRCKFLITFTIPLFHNSLGICSVYYFSKNILHHSMFSIHMAVSYSMSSISVMAEMTAIPSTGSAKTSSKLSRLMPPIATIGIVGL